MESNSKPTSANTADFFTWRPKKERRFIRRKVGKDALSPRERDCMAAIKAFHAKWGYSPSIDETGKELGLSRVRAKNIMQALKKKGHLLDGVYGSVRVFRINRAKHPFEMDKLRARVKSAEDLLRRCYVLMSASKDPVIMAYVSDNEIQIDIANHFIKNHLKLKEAT